MVVQRSADHGIAGVVLVQESQQCYELHTAVAQFQDRDDLAGR